MGCVASRMPSALAIVVAVLQVLTMSNMNRRVLLVVVSASLTLLLAACGSGGADQAQVDSVAATAVPTTPPLTVPTVTPLPTPTLAALAVPTSTPVPAPTAAPTATPAPTLEPDPSPTVVSDAAPAPTTAPETPAPTATVAAEAEAVATPTAVPTPTAGVPEGEGTPPIAADATSTPVPEAPTAVVVASGEPPIECYDPGLGIYRGYVDGVDALSFGGRVECTGAGTNAVSAARSYRHSSGLVVSRNANFRFNDAGTGYINYSGSMHFCMSGQAAVAPIVADTVPALLLVIEGEAQRQLAQGATAPVGFTGSGSQC